MAVDVGSAVGYLDLDASGFLSGLRTAQKEAESVTKNIATKKTKTFPFQRQFIFNLLSKTLEIPDF